jgi:hypothetical protein
MAKKRRYTKKEEQGLIELATILKDPHSVEANRLLDRIATHHKRMVYDFLEAAGVLMHPKWPAWYRALQTRFIEAVCSEKTKVAQAIRKALEGGQKPPIDDLIREVLRWSFIELKEWDQKGKPPRGVQPFWHEAFASLGEEVARQVDQGKTIDDVPKEWFCVLGTDYSLASVPD